MCKWREERKCSVNEGKDFGTVKESYVDAGTQCGLKYQVQEREMEDCSPIN